jgi:hypothetical protein
MFCWPCIIVYQFSETNVMHLMFYWPCITVYQYSETNVMHLMFCWPCITVYQYSETNVMHLMFCWPCITVYQHSETNVMHLMFCWPCIIVSQYSETNVMHFLFSLLRIKGCYMFRALLAHPQEALKKQHFVYCVRVMSIGCTSSTPILVQPTDITRTHYTKCRLCSIFWGWASNSRNMYT